MRAASLLKPRFRSSPATADSRPRSRFATAAPAPIIMQHSVVERGDDYPDHSLRFPVATLARALAWLRGEGVEFVKRRNQDGP